MVYVCLSVVRWRKLCHPRQKNFNTKIHIIIMDKVQRVLDIMAGMSNSMRARDRSIKVLQYGCQMLVGFYSNKFSKETIENLKAARRTASTSRKAFWMLKSVCNIGVITKVSRKYNLADDTYGAVGLDLIEQFALAFYFWFETLVFFTRMKFIGYSEEIFDGPCNMSWFIGDAACFCATVIRFWQKIRDLQNKRLELWNYKQQNFEDSNNSIMSVCLSSETKPDDYNNGSSNSSGKIIERLEREVKARTDSLTSDFLPLSIVSEFP